MHVRETASATARRNLLFRDFLRADDPVRDAWGDVKQRLAHSATNIYDYGQIKSPATEILMIAAEDWARSTAWTLRWDGQWHDELLMAILHTDPRPDDQTLAAEQVLRRKA